MAKKTLEESFGRSKIVFSSKLFFLVSLVTHCFKKEGGSVNYEALTNIRPADCDRGALGIEFDCFWALLAFCWREHVDIFTERNISYFLWQKPNWKQIVTPVKDFALQSFLMHNFFSILGDINWNSFCGYSLIMGVQSRLCRHNAPLSALYHDFGSVEVTMEPDSGR